MEIIRGGESVSQTAKSLRITDIKPAVKNQHRVNIFVDGEYNFSLDLAQVVDYKVKVGQSLTPAKLAELQHASEFGKLYQRALEYTLTRPHSEQEIKDYLKRKQIKRRIDAKRYTEWQTKLQQDPAAKLALRQARQAGRKTYHPVKPAAEITDDDIVSVLQQLKHKGYINDANFARYFVENRFVKKGVSNKRLRQELTQKGIAASLIEEALAGASARDDQTEIKKLILKKRRLKTYAQDDAKLIQYLVSQGFSYELAKNSVRETDSQS